MTHTHHDVPTVAAPLDRAPRPVGYPRYRDEVRRPRRTVREHRELAWAAAGWAVATLVALLSLPIAGAEVHWALQHLLGGH